MTEHDVWLADRTAIRGAHDLLAQVPIATPDVPQQFPVNERTRRLLSTSDVEELLSVGLLRYPFLAMIRDGTPLPIGEFTSTRRVAATDQALYVDGAKVAREFESRATIILNALEEWHRPTAELAARMASVTHGRVQVSAFLTPPRARGLAVHRDDVYVLAVQLSGTKTWTLHQPPDTDEWSPGELSSPPADPALLVNLSGGECLFLRRGRPHAADAQEDMSLHMSFTIRFPKVGDVLRAVLERHLAYLGREFLSLDAELGAVQLKSALAVLASELARGDTQRMVAGVRNQQVAASTRALIRLTGGLGRPA